MHPMSATDNVARRLLARIRRKYQTTIETLTFGELTLRFTRVADPDVVLDEIVQTQNSSHLPYWAELWESATGIASALAENPLGAHTRVLDLGCGMGLAGAVAAALGAKVLFVDVETPALLFARLNALPFDPAVRTRRLDWRVDHLGEQFDLILGADILYELQQWEFLDQFWKEHLADRGSLLLGEPGRQSGELFSPWIGERGWDLMETSQPIAPEKKPIRILRLTRRRAGDG
jgi:predicted nicotinamide N-methyase